MELTFFSILYIIWGVALGLIFKKACINRNCIILRAPPKKMIEENHIIETLETLTNLFII